MTKDTLYSSDKMADSRKIALLAASAANEKKAKDIVIQEVGSFIGMTDYFVIVTGSNPRQVDAIIDEIEDQLREKLNVKSIGREIAKDNSWSLLDFGNVIVHVFLDDAREYYRLEQLWPDAEIIDIRNFDDFSDLDYNERVTMVIDSSSNRSNTTTQQD